MEEVDNIVTDFVGKLKGAFGVSTDDGDEAQSEEPAEETKDEKISRLEQELDAIENPPEPEIDEKDQKIADLEARLAEARAGGSETESQPESEKVVSKRSVPPSVSGSSDNPELISRGVGMSAF